MDITVVNRLIKESEDIQDKLMAMQERKRVLDRAIYAIAQGTPRVGRPPKGFYRARNSAAARNNQREAQRKLWDKMTPTQRAIRIARMQQGRGIIAKPAVV